MKNLWFLLLLLLFLPLAAQEYNQTDKNGLKQGWWHYYLNSAGKACPADSAGYIKEVFYRDGVLADSARFYNTSTNKVIFRGHLLGLDPDIFDGPATFYTNTGSLMSAGLYKNNDMVGVWNYYYPSGAVFCRGESENNERMGMWEFFFESGILRMSLEYKNGKKHGNMIIWKEDGSYDQMGHFFNDKPVGTWKTWQDDGSARDDKFGPIPEEKDGSEQ